MLSSINKNFGNTCPAKVKVKRTLVQALRLCTVLTAQWGVEVHLYSFLTTALEVGKTLYPLYRRLGAPQGRSGQVRKISPSPGFDPRTVQPVASLCTGWATLALNQTVFETNVYWTVHHCNSWGMKNQLDVTCYFISLIMRSTCFGH